MENNEEVDLDKELEGKTSNEVLDKESTENKPGPESGKPGTENKSTEVKPGEEHYESPHVEVPKTTPSGEPVEKPKLSFGDSAEALVSGIDFIQRMILSWVYRAKINKRFTTDQKIAVVKTRQALDSGTKENELAKEDLAALAQWEVLLKKVRDLPFTEAEQKKLKDPLKLYCEKNNIRLGPEVGLIIAAVDVIGGRIADAVLD